MIVESLSDIPENPTICCKCKNYYCTSQNMSNDTEWYHHRCKTKKIIDFNPVNGHINQKDEFCININQNGNCAYYKEDPKGLWYKG